MLQCRHSKSARKQLGATVCSFHGNHSPMVCRVHHAQPLPEVVRDPGNMLLKSWGVLPIHKPANKHVDSLGNLPKAALSLLWIKLLPAPETYFPPTQHKAV